MIKLYYRIADFSISIESEKMNPFLLSNYAPFRVQEEEVSALLFAVSFASLPIIKKKVTRTYQIDQMTLFTYLNSNGDCDIVYRSTTTNKEYQFCARNQWTEIKMDLHFEQPEDYEVLNYFIMMAFIYSSSLHDTVLLHASCIRINDLAVAFLGHSGVGKSTHARLWLEHIAESSLINDDQPAVRIEQGIPYIYGTPWSGKTHCYKKEKARLEALFLMEQAQENEITALSPFTAFRRLLASCSMMQEERMTFNCIVRTLVEIAEHTQVYHFKNKPEKEAALLAYIYSLKGKKERTNTKIIK